MAIFMSDKVAVGASQLISTMNPEPGAMVLPEGDKMVTFALINAERYGVTSENVAEMVNSDDIAIRRLLGTEGEFGQADLGLDADFVVDVISAVGNYGEIYDRSLGPDGVVPLPRAQNELWINGGLIYAPPMK